MIVLYDDAAARRFEPFATTRPLGEVRAGALLGRERWAHWFGGAVHAGAAGGAGRAGGPSVAAFLGASHLAHFAEFDAPPMASLPLPVGTWLVNTRALPVLGAHTEPFDVVRIGGRVAAVRVRAPITDPALRDGGFDLASLVAPDAVSLDADGVWLEDAWDIIRHLTVQLAQDIPALAAFVHAKRLDHVVSAHTPVLLGDHPVFVEPGAHIEPLVVFDTTAGPVLVRRGATIQAFTRIIGPCYIGEDSIVTTDRIAASSIGPHCRVHGELSTSVFIGHANKGHDGFVGHSLLGRWVNLGAGTITSNLKNTYGPVAMWSVDGLRDTGLQFAGSFLGDHAKTGIGLRLTTGCVIGAGANIMDAMPPKVVPPFSWGTGTPYARFEPLKFLDTAQRAMARRAVTLDDTARLHLQTVMAHALTDPRWPPR